MGIEPQKEMASVAGGGATDAIMVRPALGGGEPVLLSQNWEEDGSAMNQVWWEEDPDLEKPLSGETVRLVN
ncbi:hypothetical protein BG46_19495 [Brucella anthropi]|nr:hypothetical protein BG46_19495 [Brucella anthropi]